MKKQRGISLVETLVALMLSGVILLLTFQVLLSSKNNYASYITKHHQVSNMNIAQRSIQKIVANAGIRNLNNIFYQVYRSSCGNHINCTFNGAESDQIALLHTALNGRDCLGNNIDPDHQLATILQIQSNNSESSLYCQSYNLTLGNYSSYKQPIIDGILDMQISYLQLTPTQQLISVNADQVSHWDRLVGITISLIVAGQEDSANIKWSKIRFVSRLDQPPLQLESRRGAMNIELFIAFKNRNVAL